MSDHMMECMTNPVACRMLLEVMSKERVTAKQLAEVNDDIPQTSLSRYLKNMTDTWNSGKGLRSVGGFFRRN